MDNQITGSQSHIDWRRQHALGLPAGSVRALLAILVFGTTWGLLVVRPNQEVPDYIRDLLFIIMGHYFAVRRRSGPAEQPGPPPLFLPRGSVRLLLVVGSFAVAVLLFRQGRLTALDDNPGVVTLLLIGGFLLGVALNTLATWWKERGHHTPRIVEDLRALISMAAAGNWSSWFGTTRGIIPDHLSTHSCRPASILVAWALSTSWPRLWVLFRLEVISSRISHGENAGAVLEFASRSAAMQQGGIAYSVPEGENDAVDGKA